MNDESTQLEFFPENRGKPKQLSKALGSKEYTNLYISKFGFIFYFKENTKCTFHQIYDFFVEIWGSDSNIKAEIKNFHKPYYYPERKKVFIENFCREGLKNVRPLNQCPVLLNLTSFIQSYVHAYFIFRGEFAEDKKKNDFEAPIDECLEKLGLKERLSPKIYDIVYDVIVLEDAFIL